MKLFFVLLVFAAIVFLLVELPVVTGRGLNKVKKALEQTEWIELSGKTLFISDLHLTAQPSLEKQFNLDFSSVQNVVIVGDFFNKPEDFESFGPPAGGEEERLQNVLNEIVPKRFSGKIFFIMSTHSHDPHLQKVSHLKIGEYEFISVGEYGKFRINGKHQVIAFHGGQLHGGIVGGGITWLAEKVGVALPLEKLGRKRFGIDENTWLIAGHSQVPGINHAAKVANTGSFVGAPFNKIIFRIHVGTGILFDGDRVELQEYEGLNIKKLYPFSI